MRRQLAGGYNEKFFYQLIRDLYANSLLVKK